MTTNDDWRTFPTGYFTHELALAPNPLDGAPEAAARIDAIESRMLVGGLDERVDRRLCGPAERTTVELAHDPEYLDRLERASAGDPEALARFSMPDMRVGADTYRAAMCSAGAVVEAVDALLERTVRNVFCAVRPPGHHAGRARASGFCFVNNVAVGALYALRRRRLERVAVIDFDVHHGDGTEEIVAENPSVRFFSLFQWPLFPDRRIVPTPSNVVATPLAAGADGTTLREIVEGLWLPKLEAFRPQMIFLSSGFDAHTEETMAQLKFSEVDYAYLTRRLVDASEVLCDGRLVSVLEGGYSLRSLARSVLVHLQMLGRNRT